MNNEAMEVKRMHEIFKYTKKKYEKIREDTLDKIDDILSETKETLSSRELSEMTGLSPREITDGLCHRDRLHGHNLYKIGRKTSKDRYCLLTEEGPDTSRIITFHRTRYSFKKK